MPTKLSREKQSFFDIVSENFGTLDYIVRVSNDNERSISEQLMTGTEFTINNENLGDALIKEFIINNGLEFNNNYVSALLGGTSDTTLITADNNLYTADTR